MTSTTTHITGPESTRFGILRHSIVLQLVIYYATVLLVGYVGWRFLPPAWKASIMNATHPLIGIQGDTVISISTPDPGRVAQTPFSVVLMAIIAALWSLVWCLPVSWVYMWTRRKKGFQQSVVHTLLLLPLVIAVLTTLVSRNAALAFGLAGLVAAVRFRVALDDPKDAVHVFAVMALGLASGFQLEAAAVLSVLFVTCSVILWHADYARTPPALEGERAQKHMERALAIANRTSQFVARLDREILDSMAPAQLEALQARIDRRKEKLGVETTSSHESEGPRFEGRITIRVSDPDEAQPAIEAVLEANVKRWKLVRVERTNGEGRIIYAVRPKKGNTIESLSESLTLEAAPFVADVEVERWI
jgi:hypothetical protein